jgi:hypothetical protein
MVGKDEIKIEISPALTLRVFDEEVCCESEGGPE